MTNIIVNIKPFDVNQDILVYSDGALIQETKATMDNLSSIVKSISTKFSASEINLIGNQDYLSHLKAEIGSNFERNEVNINIISH